MDGWMIDAIETEPDDDETKIVIELEVKEIVMRLFDACIV
jgi:hypothetical protein